MRILTVNLWNGGADPDALEALLAEVDPDVVCAQELAWDAAEVLRQRFPHGLVAPGAAHEGRALVSRHPVAVTEVPMPRRPALSGRMEVEEGVDLRILGVHLSNPLDGPRAVAQRRRQVAVLTQLVARPGRVVVCGDLNASPLWPAYRRLTRHLLDAPAAVARSEGRRARPTWSYRPGWRPLLRIDHVLVRGMVPTAARVDDLSGSDHRAVAVDLDPAPATAPAALG